jgi:hypothetical protein
VRISLIFYLCRIFVMDPVDEFDALAASICDEPADPDQSGAAVVLDESLLDMEDDEIQVLEPRLSPQRQTLYLPRLQQQNMKR